jgi:predicted ATPase/class 3 adenylate cyclase
MVGARKALTERMPDPALAREGERKLVTVLFADLKGSMELVADRDPEEARQLLDPVLEHMCEAVEQYGGSVSQVMGDGIMALFGAPVAAEDHAVRACHAALSMQELVRHYGDDIQRSHGIPIQIRVGLSSGEAVLSMSTHGLHASYTAIGLPVHIASRMEQMAKPGTVLATADTVRLAAAHIEVKPIGPLRVRGLERPIEVSEIRRAATTRSRFDTAPARTMTRFVGRHAELERLLETFSQTAGQPTGSVLAIVGEAGMGKSRLVYEFLRALAGKNILALDGGGAPFGSGAGYRPGAHMLRQYFNILDTDDATAVQEKVAGRIIGLSGSTASVVYPILAALRALPEDNPFFALSSEERRHQVAAALLWLARRVAIDHPLVLVYEDMQWVTSDTRNFVEALIGNLPPSTLVVLTYRSDYDAQWIEVPGTPALRLEGLSPAATTELVSALLGNDPSLDGLKKELPQRSGGNPLFIEEHVRSMIESGELQGAAGAYRLVTSHSQVEIPPTVRGVLAARIDRLGQPDKQILQALAAVGDTATVNALVRVTDISADELRKSLRRMQTAGMLVERTEGGQLAYEFKHSLMQAVAYETLLHGRRRELHLRIMEALADSAQVDVLARHAVLGEAWRQALTYLWRAGKMAAQQFADVEAVACYERALEVFKRLPPEKQSLETAIDLRFDLRNALVPLGLQLRNLEVLREAEALAAERHDERRLAQALWSIANCYGNIGRSDRALDAAERSLALAEKLGETGLLTMGALSAGEIQRTLGNYRKASEHLSRVVALIDSRDAQRLQGQVGLPAVRARSHLAWALAELGDFDHARRIAEEGLHIADASSHAYSISHACLGLGGTRVRQGEFQAAIPILARGLAVTERIPLLQPPIAADLGLSYARCGNIAEGLAHLHAAIDKAKSMSRLSRLPLIIVKCGEIHLLAGESSDALHLANDALALATEQNERGNAAYARYLLAEIHQATNDLDAAETERLFLDALAAAGELEMKPLAARCSASLGVLCLRSGKREKAHDYLSSAKNAYRAMAMRYWVDKLDADVANPA